MKISRKKFLLTAASGAGAVVAGASYMRHIEPDWFEVTRKTIKLRGLQKPLRVVHLSDFHASEDVPYSLIERALDLALNENAALACITGDFITSKVDNAAEYTRILQKLSDAMPTYACLGNHDGGSWAAKANGYPTLKETRKLLSNSNIQLLVNERASFSNGGHSVEIVGLGDLWSDNLHPERVLDSTPNENPLILLSHNPDSHEILDGYAWDLMLCGHTHGGQLVIPLLDIRPFLPIRHTQYAEGLHSWKNYQIHITRGVGNLHGMRVNCRPEISVLELQPAYNSATA